jgi:hypothetical protein
MLFKGVNKSWQLARDRIRRNLGVLLFDHKVAPVICPIADLQHVVFIRWDAKWGDAIVSSLMIAPLGLGCPKQAFAKIATPRNFSSFIYALMQKKAGYSLAYL